MSGFSIRNPYLIVVLCLVVMILGTVSVSDMPVDMFPPINLPVVAVATFSGYAATTDRNQHHLSP